MAEKVLFSVKGLHSLESDLEGEADEIEVLNPAEYYLKDGVHYVLYEEMMDGTQGVTKNIVKIRPGKVELVKKGAVNTRMEFEIGKLNQTTYYIPEGQIQMGMDTKTIVITEEENEILTKIEYGMFMNLSHVADCIIQLRITKKLTP